MGVIRRQSGQRIASADGGHSTALMDADRRLGDIVGEGGCGTDGAEADGGD